MEILKRVINLIYALSNLGWILYTVNIFLKYQDWLTFLIANAMILPLLAVICLVVNFSLFKKLTVWNK